ncbi:HNH endonuclease [Candidatus Saccharibacteria bacterium]|nr:HNH endonuclease [Candidatus Saccharibacteria bacterium]
MLQTYLGKGHGYVAGLAIWLEEMGAIEPVDKSGTKKLLIKTMDEFDALFPADDSHTHVLMPKKESSQSTTSKISKALSVREQDINFGARIFSRSVILVFMIIGIIATYDLKPIVFKNDRDKITACLGVALVFVIVITALLRSIYYYKKTKQFFESSESPFGKLKKKIQKNTEDINNLNEHVRTLKESHLNGVANIIDRGKSELTSGGYNYRRSGWSELSDERMTHYCSLQVVKNSKVQPFKYICKYFDITPNEENLEYYEEMFNDYSAAKQGQMLLLRERNEIFLKIDDYIPDYILKFSPNLLVEKLGFTPTNKKDFRFETYNFSYVSAGGNSIAKNTVVMDMDNLEGFIKYLNSQIKWKNSIAGQRALMTALLREKIKQRDRYTCKKCGASVFKEPNLLLEIDHIVPLARGGKTTEDNLQTLCWRCNRKKGSKIES